MATEELMNTEATTYADQTAVGAAGTTVLEVKSLPTRKSYKPGEEITYAGATFAFDGADVTNDVMFSVPAGTTWKADDKMLVVDVTYAGAGAPATAQITLRRKSRIWPLVILLAAAVAAGTAAAFVAFNATQPQNDTGSYLIPQGNMTDEEAQRMLNEQAEKSRITISVAPEMKLRPNGELRINFVVPEPNNGYPERIEIQQDGQVVFKSDIVNPGYMIEWAPSSGAHVGDAVATIYAVNSQGGDTGNPTSVEVKIIEATE